MAEDVGALVARVVADNEQFRSDMLKMTRQLESNTARMNKGLARVNTGMSKFGSTTRTVTRFLAGFGVALGAREIFQFTSRVISSERELQSLSVRLGGTTEALSELKYVAEQSDVQFSVLSLGLQRATRRIAEAAAGTGEAKGALRELNLDAQALARLPLDQQFEAVAEQLSQVKSESDKVRLAMKLFDSEGVALVQTMERGAAGIQEMREEARQLGITLDSDAAKAAADAAESMDRLKAATASLARNLVDELVPGLISATEALREFLFPTGKEALDDQLNDTLAAIDRMEAKVNTARIDRDAIGVKVYTDQLEELRAKLREIINAYDDLSTASGSSAIPPEVLLSSPGVETRRRRDIFSITDQYGADFDQVSQREITDEHLDAMKEAQREHTAFLREEYTKREKLARELAEREVDLAFRSAQSQAEFRQDLAALSAQLLYAVFGESKAVALAAIAFEKLMAVRRIKITTEQASWLAFASQLIPGDPSSLPRAQAARAAVRAQGAVSVGRTIALSVVGGLAEAAQVLRSDGSPGSFTNPLSVTGGSSAASSAAGAAGAAHSQRVLQVVFQGDVYGWDDYMKNRVVASFRELVNDKDVVVINANSRQAAVFR